MGNPQAHDIETRSVKGIIFDLDGTLVDSEHLHTEAWEKLLERFGCLPATDGWADEYIGIPDSDTRDILVQRYSALRDAGDILEMKQSLYREMVLEQGRALAMPGVPSRIKQLFAAGIPLAVGTNSILDNCRSVLDVTGMLPHFTSLVTFDHVEHGKPAPDIFAAAARNLGFSPSECAVVEDTPTGIRAGRAAGIFVVGVTNTMEESILTDAGADVILPDTASAIDWLATRLKQVRKPFLGGLTESHMKGNAS